MICSYQGESRVAQLASNSNPGGQHAVDIATCSTDLAHVGGCQSAPASFCAFPFWDALCASIGATHTVAALEVVIEVATTAALEMQRINCCENQQTGHRLSRDNQSDHTL